MKRLRRFAGFSGGDKLLLLKTGLLVSAIRIGLWVLPARAIRRLVRRTAEKPHRIYSVERLVWAVRAVSRTIPGSTCLTQALACQILLARSGYHSRVEIGVAKDQQRFEAHAWLVCENRIVIGGPKVERYSPLTAWEGRP